MGAYAVLEDGVEEPQGIAGPGRSGGSMSALGGTEDGAMRYSFGDYVLDTARQEWEHAGAPVQSGVRRFRYSPIRWRIARGSSSAGTPRAAVA